MKKSILSLTSIIMILISVGCNDKKDETTSSEKNTANAEAASETDYSMLGFGNILIDSPTTYKYKTNFEDRIRRFPLGVINDKISKSVWFSKDAIKLLASYLLADSNNLDGARIHFISYDSLNTAPGQYKPHQVSIVIVPTNPKPGNAKKHIDNWQILSAEKAKADEYLRKLHILFGLNHGELCPQQCEQ